ncbi:MAG TPA: cystathionine beta-lyase, partial [Rhodospirillales bacterium]|nr:cystathionine beta-lyase [Rhodospirillales bacterium]
MKKRTRLLHAGRNPTDHHGIVNPPVYHASTILYATVADMEAAGRAPFDGVTYGLRGTPTTFAFQDAVSELEHGYRTIAVCSGLAAVTGPLMAFLKAGDHVLVPDSVYGPTRYFCDRKLSRFEIETTYYDPLAGAAIADQFQDNTRVLFMESPGSLTFQVQDIPAMTAAAKEKGIVTIIDNTWSAGHFFQPLDLGVDVSIQAATKYIGGHSDLMMGTITTTEETFLTVARGCDAVGFHAAPDDCYLALRGLRSLPARLAVHEQTALIL